MKNVHEGELLRKWLRDSGITQEDFAGKLDMTRQNLGVYMRKEKLPANFKELIQVKGFSFNVNQNYTSSKHLNRYCDEFSYRYNTRDITDCDRFCSLLAKSNGRLTYEHLVYGQQ